MHAISSPLWFLAHAGVDPSGASWQPWADWLVYVALAALPWCGQELAASCNDALVALLGRAQAYMEARPVAVDELLKPMSGARGPDDMAAQ